MWADLQTRRLSGLSYYNSLQVLVNRRFTSGLEVQGAYTYSRSIDTSGGLFSEEADNSAVGIEIPDRIYNEKGLSNFDTRHIAVANFLYELPFGRNLQGLSKHILNGWELGGIATFANGVPFTVENSVNRSQNLAVQASQSDRPNLVAGASNNPTSGVSRGCFSIPAGTPLGTPRLYFDPCAFSPQPLGTFGNLGRNTLIGPGLTNFDFSLNKHFRMSERTELQFRTEFFNVMNHPNFEGPTLTNRRIFDLQGRLTSGAGVLTKTTTTSRQVQFGLKLIF